MAQGFSYKLVRIFGKSGVQVSFKPGFFSKIQVRASNMNATLINWRERLRVVLDLICYDSKKARRDYQ